MRLIWQFNYSGHIGLDDFVHSDHNQIEERLNGLGHVLSGGSAGFKVWDPEFVGLIVGLGPRNRSFGFQVGLVATEYNVRVFAIRVQS